MKNRLSLCQKNLLTEKKNTMSWENIPASLTCGRDNNGTDERKKIIV